MISATFKFEKKLWNQGLERILGIDEVGRGCFAGPLVAAGVMFDKNKRLPYKLFDSKMITAKQRESLAEKIKRDSIAYTIVTIEVNTINDLGIGKSIQLAFKFIIENFALAPQHVLIDGFGLKLFQKSKQTPIIRGDAISNSIAAASILAKVHRDTLMKKLDKQFLEYNFAKNKGYGTKEHRYAIAKFGLSPLHRTSFDIEKYTVLSE